MAAVRESAVQAGAEVFEPTAPGDRLLFLQCNKRFTEAAQLVTDFVNCTETNAGDDVAVHAGVQVLRARKERVRELTRQLLADSMHLACHNRAHEGGRRDCAECRAELLPPLLDVLACAAVDVRELGGDIKPGLGEAMVLPAAAAAAAAAPAASAVADGVGVVDAVGAQALKPLLSEQIVGAACAAAVAAAGTDARADAAVHARPGLFHLASTIATSGPIANFCGDLLDSVGEAERGASMGGVCGHVFREGEIVWTCRQCASGPTTSCAATATMRATASACGCSWASVS